MSEPTNQTSQQSNQDGISPPKIPTEIKGKSLTLPSTTEEEPSESIRKVSNSSDIKADNDYLLKFSEALHRYLLDIIRLADQKAAFVFAATTTLFAWLYQKGLSNHWLKPINTWNIADVLAFVATFGLASCSILSFWVIVPRLSGRNRGYIFWEAIAEFQSGGDYSNNISGLNSKSLATAILEHCFDLSLVCREKYKFLRLALFIGLFGLCSAVLFVLFFM